MVLVAFFIIFLPLLANSFVFLMKLFYVIPLATGIFYTVLFILFTADDRVLPVDDFRLVTASIILLS